MNEWGIGSRDKQGQEAKGEMKFCDQRSVSQSRSSPVLSLLDAEKLP